MPRAKPQRRNAGSSPPVRLYAAILGLLCLALLITGASLSASDAGHGTHTQLGLPPCAFAMTLGKPCATCGMTTAVTVASSGNLARAFVVPPFGAGIALAAATAFWMCLYVAATGSRLWKLAVPLLRPRPMLALTGLLLVSWVYKMIVWTA